MSQEVLEAKRVAHYMAMLYSLSSSSKGNCSYIGTKKCGVLIDVGIGVRAFAAHLRQIEVEPDAIQAIFITHEHTDHVKGLAGICRAFKNIPIYASRGTLVALLEKGIVSPSMERQLKVISASEENAVIIANNIKVTSFATPHDSRESQCYTVHTSDQKKVSICTDLGYVPSSLLPVFQQSDLVMLESNYQKELLQIGPYPSFLKRRIAGQKGHLSNDDCAKTLVELKKMGISKFVLGHLSAENNRPNLAYQTVIAAMDQIGALIDRDYQLWIAPPMNNGQVILL